MGAGVSHRKKSAPIPLERKRLRRSIHAAPLSGEAPVESTPELSFFAEFASRQNLNEVRELNERLQSFYEGQNLTPGEEKAPKGEATKKTGKNFEQKNMGQNHEVVVHRSMKNDDDDDDDDDVAPRDARNDYRIDGNKHDAETDGGRDGIGENERQMNGRRKKERRETDQGDADADYDAIFVSKQVKNNKHGKKTFLRRKATFLVASNRLASSDDQRTENGEERSNDISGSPGNRSSGDEGNVVKEPGEFGPDSPVAIPSKKARKKLAPLKRRSAAVGASDLVSSSAASGSERTESEKEERKAPETNALPRISSISRKNETMMPQPSRPDSTLDSTLKPRPSRPPTPPSSPPTDSPPPPKSPPPDSLQRARRRPRFASLAASVRAVQATALTQGNAELNGAVLQHEETTSTPATNGDAISRIPRHRWRRFNEEKFPAGHLQGSVGEEEAKTTTVLPIERTISKATTKPTPAPRMIAASKGAMKAATRRRANLMRSVLDDAGANSLPKILSPL